MSAASIMVMPVREAYSGRCLESPRPLPQREAALRGPGRACEPSRKTEPAGPAPLRRDGLGSNGPRCVKKQGLPILPHTGALNGLVEKNRVCLPAGDAGGRGRPLRIHLHPDGCPCDLPKVSLKRGKPAPPEEGRKRVKPPLFIGPRKCVKFRGNFRLKCVKSDECI
jgi:hypothetical protein